MKHRWLPLFCTIVFVTGLFVNTFLASATGEKVYFMSVNDTVLDLNDETMPISINGSLYVPYILFDPTATKGVELGVYSTYSRAKGVLMLYGWDGTLVFDLNEDTTTFGDRTYTQRAIVRNSMVFVPVDLVCFLFGLQSSLLAVEHGVILRVKNEDAVLNDQKFVNAATYAVNARYQSYMQSKTEVETPPTITSVPEPSIEPSQPSGTTIQEEQTQVADGATIYLAFRMTEGEGFSELLQRLKQQGIYAIFFCEVGELSNRDDDIRRLLAAGHRIGLLLTGDTLEMQRNQLVQGREILIQIARTETVIVLSEGLNDTDRTELGKEVYLWHTTLDGTMEGHSLSQQVHAVIRSIQRQRLHFVLMDDKEQSVKAMSQICIELMENGCDFPLVNEVVISNLSE